VLAIAYLVVIRRSYRGKVQPAQDLY